MTKTKSVFQCTECGTAAPQWSGRCGGCGEWNTIVEEVERRAALVRGVVAAAPVPLGDVPASAATRRSTGIPELDRVLGGGLVAGSVTLVGGEPGVGKSTLLLQAGAAMAARGTRVLLVSAEESLQQVRLRGERLEALHPLLLASAETLMPAIFGAIEHGQPDVVIIDSIQTVSDPELSSPPGSVGQVRECAHALVRLAKQSDVTVVLVGHVTKEGSLAGPRVLEHIVDTVLSFDGERHHSLRLLRAQKHRFGSTGELGLFEMDEAGLTGVTDPSGLFLADRSQGVPGSVVVPTMQGNRPLLVEIQALVAESKGEHIRRSAHGIDPSRVAMLLAVLENHTKVKLEKHDVFVSVVGGVRVSEPAADLAVLLAVASAREKRALPEHLAACGEVGLAGEIRQVGHMARRFGEAARLGFTAIAAPPSAPIGPDGVRVHRLRYLESAMRAAQLY